MVASGFAVRGGKVLRRMFGSAPCSDCVSGVVRVQSGVVRACACTYEWGGL
jgi:hypothetical protein